ALSRVQRDLRAKAPERAERDVAGLSGPHDPAGPGLRALPGLPADAPGRRPRPAGLLRIQPGRLDRSHDAGGGPAAQGRRLGLGWPRLRGRCGNAGSRSPALPAPSHDAHAGGPPTWARISPPPPPGRWYGCYGFGTSFPMELVHQLSPDPWAPWSEDHELHAAVAESVLTTRQTELLLETVHDPHRDRRVAIQGLIVPIIAALFVTALGTLISPGCETESPYFGKTTPPTEQRLVYA